MKYIQKECELEPHNLHVMLFEPTRVQERHLELFWQSTDMLWWWFICLCIYWRDFVCIVWSFNVLFIGYVLLLCILFMYSLYNILFVWGIVMYRVPVLFLCVVCNILFVWSIVMHCFYVLLLCFVCMCCLNLVLVGYN